MGMWAELVSAFRSRLKTQLFCTAYLEHLPLVIDTNVSLLLYTLFGCSFHWCSLSAFTILLALWHWVLSLERSVVITVRFAVGVELFVVYYLLISLSCEFTTDVL